jgi:hypothetical protein
VVALLEDVAAAVHDLLEGAGDTDAEALHADRERAAIVGLDEQVDVIAHDGVVDDLEVVLRPA